MSVLALWSVRRIAFIAAIAMTVAIPGIAQAAGAAITGNDAWPVRPIRIVVAQAPGGPPDLIARFIAEPLGRTLGQPVVVENRPGASGIIGVDFVAHAASDGYTLLVATQSTHALVPHVMPNVKYDALRDFAPISNLFRSTKVLWVTSSLPVRNLTEFIVYARARAASLNYASGGTGSSNHLDARLFMRAADVTLVHVPYNGPSAAIAAVASGDAQMMVVSITTGIGLLQAGRIRPLAILSAQRSPLLPDVPTAIEQGLPDLEVGAWIGLVAPAGTSADVVARLNREISVILGSTEARTWTQANGLELAGGSADAFAATLASDYQRWGNVIRQIGLRGE